MHCSELAVSVQEDLGSQDLVQQLKVNQTLLFGSGLFVRKQ